MICTEAALSALAAYRLPALEARLLGAYLTPSISDAQQLFCEVKRYLFLVGAPRARELAGHSRRLAYVWSEFALFTAEYAAFCERFGAGVFPQSRPCADPGAALRSEYGAYFGPLPPCWYDDLAVQVDTRLVRRAGAVGVRAPEATAELIFGTRRFAIGLGTGSRPVAEFIANHPDFYVRELPLAQTEDAVALCARLVACRCMDWSP